MLEERQIKPENILKLFTENKWLVATKLTIQKTTTSSVILKGQASAVVCSVLFKHDETRYPTPTFRKVSWCQTHTRHDMIKHVFYVHHTCYDIHSALLFPLTDTPMETWDFDQTSSSIGSILPV